MPSDAIAADLCHCLALRSAARHVTQLYDGFLAAVGLTSTQFSIMAKLKRKGRFAISTLARDMVMDRSTLTRNMQPLERDGLISIGSSAQDRRSKEIRLTKAGEKRIEMGLKAWADAQARFESSVGGKQSAELRSMLHAVAANPFGES